MPYQPYQRESRVTFKLTGGAHADICIVHESDLDDYRILAKASGEYAARYGFEPLRYASEGYAIDARRPVRI